MSDETQDPHRSLVAPFLLLEKRAPLKLTHVASDENTTVITFGYR